MMMMMTTSNDKNVLMHQQMHITSLQTFLVDQHQSNHGCDTACPTWQLLEAFSFQDPAHKPWQNQFQVFLNGHNNV